MPPEIYNVLRDFGPIILSVMGGILALFSSALVTIARYAWKSHQKRMELMATALRDLANGIKKTGDHSESEHKKIWDAVNGLRAEFHLGNQRTDHIKAGLLSVEGTIKNQQDTIMKYVERLVTVDSKLDAVFRIIDARARATDPKSFAGG